MNVKKTVVPGAFNVIRSRFGFVVDFADEYAVVGSYACDGALEWEVVPDAVRFLRDYEIHQWLLVRLD